MTGAVCAMWSKAGSRVRVSAVIIEKAMCRASVAQPLLREKIESIVQGNVRDVTVTSVAKRCCHSQLFSLDR